MSLIADVQHLWNCNLSLRFQDNGVRELNILLGGAGGTPTTNVIKSLRCGGANDRLIGMSSVLTDLIVADVDERFLVPNAIEEGYAERLFEVIQRARPSFIHVQNDFEVRAVSRLRERLKQAGVSVYLPAAEAVENAVDKGKSYKIWLSAGVPVPNTAILHDATDLRRIMDECHGQVWLRATEGAAGRGALPVNSFDEFEFAKLWVERFGGWGKFTGAEKLTSRTVTWLSIWFEGALIVAQTRARRSWKFEDRALSGVTGITGVSETCSSDEVTQVALQSIQAIDSKPHGIFGVDMCYDSLGHPRVTEINIGRFFTTCYFFTAAGLNLPQIYRDIALEKKFPNLRQKINPLPNGLVWIRNMDVEPMLKTAAQLSCLGAVG